MKRRSVRRIGRMVADENARVRGAVVNRSALVVAGDGSRAGAQGMGRALALSPNGEARSYRSFLRRFRRASVDGFVLAGSAASFLPSSTPHWSNESMPQRTPSTNTLCS